MKSNYKKLGQYIQQVSIKNTDLKIDNLLGVSITKEFIPSIANTIGTDMSTYKVVKKGQFTYGSITSRNGDKISIALLQDEVAIVSTSYTVFEIIDTNELIPEYLMMWFRREEFDRYARYMSHGSTREAFGWSEMCDVELPVPSIDKQKEIVKEYHTIVDRIKLNEQLNQKLEDTAQSIYKEWFVNFEFPDVNGKPYKSSGGEMEYCDELDMEIPKGWILSMLNEIIKFQEGPGIRNWQFSDNGIPFLNIRCIKDNDIDTKITNMISHEEASSKYKHFMLDEWDIVISTSGTLGKYAIIRQDHLPLCLNTSIIRFIPIPSKSTFSFIFSYLTSDAFYKELLDNATGSAQVNFGPTHLNQIKMLTPPFDIQSSYNNLVFPITKHTNLLKIELRNLNKLLQILLSKMATIED